MFSLKTSISCKPLSQGRALVSVLYAVVVSIESDSDYFKIVLIVSVLTSVFLSIFFSNSFQADLLFVSS